MSTEFVKLIFTKLGLGIGAYVSNMESINNRIHQVLGDDLYTEINGNFIKIVYKSRLIELLYTIENNKVIDLKIM